MKKFNTDGMANIYTGMGVKGKDKQTGTTVVSDSILSEASLNVLYRTNRRIIDLPTSEMLRAGYTVTNDPDGETIKALKEIRAKQKLTLALRWSHLFGGGLIVMLIDDGNVELSEPLNEKNIKSIKELRVYDRHKVNWSSADLYSDENKEKYGEPEFYNITSLQSSGESAVLVVHETRCLRFDGLSIPDKLRQENNGWGDNVFQGIFRQLSDLDSVFHASENIVEDFIQIIVQIEGLSELLGTEDGEALVKKRLEIFDLGSHVMNMIMMDKDESYTKVASSVTGLPEVISKFEGWLASKLGWPITLLTMNAPKGFDSKDDGSMRKWYDKIVDDQEDELRPQLERLIYLTMLSKEGPFKGTEVKDWALEFNKLWQPTEAELIETRLNQAKIDNLNINNTMLTSSEVAISRYGGTEYSYDTVIDVGARKQEDPKPEDDKDKDDA